MRSRTRIVGALLAVLAGATALPETGRADSILYRCNGNICRAGVDGSGRQQLTKDGSYAWLSATRDGSRMAVSRATFAYVLDGSGRQIGAALPRGGTTLVAQIAPDGSAVATLELLGELTPAPPMGPPGAPPTLGYQPYMFTAAPDGSGRAVVARDVIETAWLGGRLLRDDEGSQAPYPRSVCLLASNTDFHCERAVANDPASDLSAPAVSPDGRLVAAARSPAGQNRGMGSIALFDASSGALVRALTTGSDDGLPSFSPDGRQVVFNRGSDIYAIAVDGALGSERRVIANGLQPVWVTAGDVCRPRSSVRPTVHGRTVTVSACAPGAGRLTVTLTRHGRRVARRTVTARAGGAVDVRFTRPRGTGALRATVRFNAA